MLTLNITDLHDSRTVCPTQFSFNVIGHPLYKEGYIRFRHGFLRLDLYGDKAPEGFPCEERSFGIRVSHDENGELCFGYIVKFLRNNAGVHLKWDGETVSDEKFIQEV